ncbi:hypothetical protein DL765_000950 [Monosporascus sp. GIB2]|nr:hypothetical protein DL765_000950 [Monosporascus sp. GIB2]
MRMILGIYEGDAERLTLDLYYPPARDAAPRGRRYDRAASYVRKDRAADVTLKPDADRRSNIASLFVRDAYATSRLPSPSAAVEAVQHNKTFA